MNKIVFIDDDTDIRATYELSMQMMFGELFEIVCLDVKPSLKEMMLTLDTIPDKVTYLIDEKLKHSGVATYTGSELVEQIRFIDTKIPIYMLTSYAGEIEQYFGDVEFVIDKNDWDSDEEEENLKKRFLRHINTYADIKSTQAKRFDELFEKSIFSTLSNDEIKEFDALNIGRSKALVDERLISEESLAELKAASDELDDIYNNLKTDNDE
ncbi:hypothetical protein L1D44_09370 [Shewanella sp. Isolate13]|uniref:hypothetical protein n=1 Tax=Shewanella sp. Isolate13 TaxID=2908531 RepID=UPI001EFDAA35|nr:hypothetical protein [Shewanella sp. Isolate13]MCG9730058.1 hypothetical protein [Shewanella sp. Isolate13]